MPTWSWLLPSQPLDFSKTLQVHFSINMPKMLFSEVVELNEIILLRKGFFFQWVEKYLIPQRILITGSFVPISILFLQVNYLGNFTFIKQICKRKEKNFWKSLWNWLLLALELTCAFVEICSTFMWIQPRCLR